MKNINLLSLAFIILAIMLSFSSCEKDTEMSKNNTNNDEIYMIGDDQTEAKILNFIERMDLVRENPEYEGSDEWNYSFDSTIWYVEATLNYKYAGLWLYEGSEEHSDLYETDSSGSYISPTNDYYNIVDLQEAYDDLANSLVSQYNNIEDDNKFFVLSDISGLTNDLDEIVLSQFSVIGKADKTIPVSGWMWGLDQGKCDGTLAPKDATDILEFMNSSTLVDNTPDGYYAYYTNDHSTTIDPNMVPLSQNPFGFGYNELFIGNDNTCMSYDMLNYYHQYIKTFKNRFVPSNKDYIYDDINWSIVYSTKGSGYHYSDIKYGDRHIARINNPTE